MIKQGVTGLTRRRAAGGMHGHPYGVDFFTLYAAHPGHYTLCSLRQHCSCTVAAWRPPHPRPLRTPTPQHSHYNPIKQFFAYLFSELSIKNKSELGDRGLPHVVEESSAPAPGRTIRIYRLRSPVPNF